MRARNRNVGHAAACAGVLMTVVALAGCSNAPEPSNLETPDVVWPDGEPFGAFKDDPAAKSVGLLQVNFAIALNARDYSDADLVNAIGVKRAQSLADALQRELGFRNLRELTNAGPDPFLILDVNTHANESTVVMCAYAGRNTAGSRQTLYYSVTFSAQGGAYLTPVPDPPAAAKTAEEYRAECEASDIPVGLFDPAPEPHLDPDAKVIGPAAADKYDLD